jgi:hypothetical protein
MAVGACFFFFAAAPSSYVAFALSSASKALFFEKEVKSSSL